jgi:hypothetical protein
VLPRDKLEVEAVDFGSADLERVCKHFDDYPVQYGESSRLSHDACKLEWPLLKINLFNQRAEWEKKEAARSLSRSSVGKSAEPCKMTLSDFAGFMLSRADIFPQLATLFMCALAIPVRGVRASCVARVSSYTHDDRYQPRSANEISARSGASKPSSAVC